MKANLQDKDLVAAFQGGIQFLWDSDHDMAATQDELIATGIEDFGPSDDWNEVTTRFTSMDHDSTWTDGTCFAIRHVSAGAGVACLAFAQHNGHIWKYDIEDSPNLTDGAPIWEMTGSNAR